MPNRYMHEMISLRREPRQSDLVDAATLLAGTGVFYSNEIKVAEELVQDALQKGEQSEYKFLFADMEGGGLAGLVCYGYITMTDASYDIYWLAVNAGLQGKGIGYALMRQTLSLIRRDGGKRIYVDTSSRKDYTPAVRLYEKTGFRLVATVPDYFAEADDKLILMLTL